MQGIEVGIDEILNCREKRVVIQNAMIRKYRKPVISFTMNIPGPIKTNNEIKNTFDIGKNLILEKLKENTLLKIEEIKVQNEQEILKREKELSNSAMYSMMGDATKDLFTGIFNSPEFKEEMSKKIKEGFNKNN